MGLPLHGQRAPNGLGMAPPQEKGSKVVESSSFVFALGNMDREKQSGF